MSQTRPFQVVGGGGGGGGGGNINIRGHFDDTTYTKIFVGGLAWETQRDTMRRYFEQFGEIQEAVVITDKITGRSKGYGFVTFKDPDAATRACQNPSPVIDGRRANCNLASLGAHKARPSTPQHGTGRFRPTHGLVSPPASAYHHQGSSSTYFHQPTGQYTFPYSAYGYTGYSQDTMYPLNYYSVYGGQQFSPYYTAGTSGVYQNVYPFYAQNSQQAHGHCVGIHQYPRMVQYPYLPQHYSSMGIQLSLPSSVPTATTITDSTVLASRIQNTTGVTAVAVTGTCASQASKTVSQQNTSS